jgi:hypothetical protein
MFNWARGVRDASYDRARIRIHDPRQNNIRHYINIQCIRIPQTRVIRNPAYVIYDPEYHDRTYNYAPRLVVPHAETNSQGVERHLKSANKNHFRSPKSPQPT